MYHCRVVELVKMQAFALWIEASPVPERPGGDLLSHVLRRSTIGAEAFHGRVRDGIGCLTPRHDHQVTEAQDRRCYRKRCMLVRASEVEDVSNGDALVKHCFGAGLLLRMARLVVSRSSRSSD